MDEDKIKKITSCKSKEDLANLLNDNDFIEGARILTINEKDGSSISVSLKELIDKVGKEAVIDTLINVIDEFKVVPVKKEDVETVIKKIKHGETLTEKELEIKHAIGIEKSLKREQETQAFVHEIIATLSKTNVGFDSVGDIAVFALNILNYVVLQGPKVSQLENGKVIAKIGEDLANDILSTWKNSLVSENAISNDMIILGCIYIIGNIICSEQGKDVVNHPFDPKDYCDFQDVDFDRVIQSVDKLPRFKGESEKGFDDFANYLKNNMKGNDDLRDQLKN